jgi:hypothetical protein
MCIQDLDGDFFEKVQEFFTLLARMEQSCADVVHGSFEVVATEAAKV